MAFALFADGSGIAVFSQHWDTKVIPAAQLITRYPKLADAIEGFVIDERTEQDVQQMIKEYGLD